MTEPFIPGAKIFTLAIQLQIKQEKTVSTRHRLLEYRGMQASVVKDCYAHGAASIRYTKKKANEKMVDAT